MALIQIGTLYLKNQPGFPFKQPGGPGTQVFPAQAQDPLSATPPYQVTPISEFTGVFRPGCGHSIMSWMVFQDYDDFQGPVNLVTCSECSYIQSVYPYPEVLNTEDYPIIVG